MVVALERGYFQCVIVESNSITNFKNMLSVYRSFKSMMILHVGTCKRDPVARVSCLTLVSRFRSSGN